MELDSAVIKKNGTNPGKWWGKSSPVNHWWCNPTTREDCPTGGATAESHGIGSAVPSCGGDVAIPVSQEGRTAAPVGLEAEQKAKEVYS